MNYYNYFTEIEEHFVRRRGKHLLISPMDWGLIASWKDAGVPLQVALRGIDIAMDGFAARQRGHSRVNTLAYCHDSVMSEYANHMESHVGEAVEEGSSSEKKDEPGTGEILDFLSERISEIRTLAGKQSQERTADGINRVLGRMEEIFGNVRSRGRIETESLERDLSIADDLLMNELRPAVSPEQMLTWETEAKKLLKVYKKNLPKETYEKIRANFFRDKIHQYFNIGELSIFRL